MGLTEAAKTIHGAALELCGITDKNVNLPWMKGRERESENFGKNSSSSKNEGKSPARVNETIDKVHKYKRRSTGQLSKNIRDNGRTNIGIPSLKRPKMPAREMTGAKCTRRFKKLGLRDDKRSAPSEQFSADEFITHFEKVSKERSEHTSVEIQGVIIWIPDRREEQEVKRAAEKLGKEVTVGELLEQMNDMSDGAAGKDNVTIGIGMIRKS